MQLNSVSVNVNEINGPLLASAEPGEVTQLPLVTVQDRGLDSDAVATQLPILLVDDDPGLAIGTQLPLLLVEDDPGNVVATQLPLILVRQRALGGRIRLGYTIGLEVLTQ